MKKCVRCLELKEDSEFSKNRNCCKKCKAIITSEYRKSRPKQVNIKHPLRKCENCEKYFFPWGGGIEYCSDHCNFSKGYEKKNECWIWRNENKINGYGIFGTKGKNLSAHRAAYMLFKGEIGNGLDVCHTCDNRRCVNPEHLFLGTRSVNMKDCLKKGRLSCGEMRYNAKLTENDIKDIRRKRIEGKTYREIGQEHGVSYETCYDIANYRTWKHISD